MLFSITIAGFLVSQTPSATPNDFFKRGTPAFVVGTAGNDRVDKAVKAQAALIRDLLFPAARIIDDSAIDLVKGHAAWPANPVLYGGPHVHHTLAKLGGSLPFHLEQGKLSIGGQEFVGDEYRLIAVIPARAPDNHGPGHPEFLLYAGTGSPGVGEINSVRGGGESILIADSFGRLVTGTWQKQTDGSNAASLAQSRSPRIAWRTVDRELKLNAAAKSVVHVQFPKQLPPAADEEQVISTCLRGLAQAAEKLGEVSSADISIYVYPDLNSIASLTGQRGDGHAVVESRVLHVVRPNPSAVSGWEKLLAHEGTHVLAYDSWGGPGTPLFGEGVAVWASGSYGGVPLNEWKRRVQQPVPTVVELLAKSFRQLPENRSYPLAGILFEVAVEKVGLANVRQHLYGATASTWESACRASGTTPQALEAAFRTKLGRP
jgi:hypothetical protein